MEEEKLMKINESLKIAKELLHKIEEKRNSRIVTFLTIGEESINIPTVYRLNKILRTLGKQDRLDLFIESGGGDIDAAAKIIKLLREHCNFLAVLIPFFAKSAASLIALNADEIILTKAGELGPIDPQVKDPVSGLWIPAHSIKQALDFIEKQEDPLVKVTLTDKLSPLLLGAFRDAQDAVQQYVEEECEKFNEEIKHEIIETFTQKYLSHGYPITRDKCKELGLPVTYPDDDLEELMYDLHQIYIDSYFENDIESILLIQTSKSMVVVVDGEDIGNKLLEFEEEKKSEK